MARRDIPVWLVGVLLAALLTFADLKLDDKAVTLILACMFPLLLGIWRPERPWRWVLLFSLPLIVARGALVFTQHLEHWEGVAYSFVTLFPAAAGAYLGAVCRRAIEALWQQKE